MIILQLPLNRTRFLSGIAQFQRRGRITSGIDMALSMVEEDWGSEMALYVRALLVVFLKRPGGQSQFSAYMTSESATHPDLKTYKPGS